MSSYAVLMSHVSSYRYCGDGWGCCANTTTVHEKCVAVVDNVSTVGTCVERNSCYGFLAAGCGDASSNMLCCM